MRKATITVYQFSELSEEAKERVRHNEMQNTGYSWSDEAIKSLEALAEHFDSKLVDYSIDWFNSSPSYVEFASVYHSEEQLKNLISKLGSVNPETGKGKGNCVLTGYWVDEDAIDWLREVFNNGERVTVRLLQAAFEALLEVCQEDCKHQYSDEGLAELAEANDWEFLENGDIFVEKKS